MKSRRNYLVGFASIATGVLRVPGADVFADHSSSFTPREPGRYLRALKSVLGTKLFEETTQVKQKRYAFGEIIAAFLRFLRTAAGKSLGALPTSVVLGRPAFFVDDNPEADAAAERQLEAAARAAGFESIAFQFEPIAAALDYE